MEKCEKVVTTLLHTKLTRLGLENGNKKVRRELKKGEEIRRETKKVRRIVKRKEEVVVFGVVCHSY